jgi:hypothetical protein
VNRKLIRTTLAEVKGKAREVPQPRERSNGSSRASSEGREQRAPQQHASSVQVKKRVPPPNETNGEEIEGTIEWYDRGALKVNRKGAPNLLVLKRNIKYIYKADERVETASA